MSFCNRYGLLFILAIIPFFLTPSTNAGPWVWDGGGADDSLLTGENWNPDAIPFFDVSNTAANNTDSALIFTGNVRTTPLVGDAQHYNQITFDASAGAFTFFGGTRLRIGPTSTGIPRPITNNSSNAQTFNVEVTGSAVDFVANTADLVFNQDFKVATNATGSSSASTRRNQILAGNVYFNSGFSGFGTDKLPGPNQNNTGNLAGTGGTINAVGGTAYITAASESIDTDHIDLLWNGRVEIYNGNVRISHDNALGAGALTDTSFHGSAYDALTPAFPDNPPPLRAGRTTIGAGGVTNAGRLELAGDADGSINSSEYLYVTGRSASFSSAAAHIRNVNGTNTLSGPIQAQNIADARSTVIEANDDGLDAPELLTIAGDIMQGRDATGGGSNGLVLRGNGAGLLSGNILNGANPATMTWEVHKYDSGTWTIDSAGNNYTGQTQIGGGTLALGSTGSIAKSSVIQIDAAGTLDVSAQAGFTVGASGVQAIKGDGAVTGDVNIAGGSSLVVDYSGSSMDSLSISGNLNITNATIDFNKIGSTLTAGAHVLASYGSLSGAAFASVLDLPLGFNINYNYLGGNQIALVGAPITGDFDGDGDVDGADFLAWQTNFPKASGALRAQGDGNGDGAVNSADLGIWKSQFGTAGSSVSAAPVPEPSSWLICLSFAARGLMRREASVPR